MTVHSKADVARCDADITRTMIDRCLAGDDAAWQWLAAQYWPVCRAIAARILGRENASYAPDVAQDTFVVVLLKLNSWRGQSDESFGAWISKLAWSRALNFRKAQRYWFGRCEIIDTDHPSGMERRFDAPRWLSGDIEATKRRLPERQRHVLDGLEAGHTQREMAWALGVSRATIRKEIVAMRIHLKRIFGKISEI
jgi:RNA polymerase sigma factor (sigma-70 family)